MADKQLKIAQTSKYNNLSILTFDFNFLAWFLFYITSHANKVKYNMPFPSCFLPVSKRVQVRNLSNENEFDLHENEHVSETNFHMNGSYLDSFSKRGKSQLGNGLWIMTPANISRLHRW